MADVAIFAILEENFDDALLYGSSQPNLTFETSWDYGTSVTR
jgi:hypothetical protein